MSKRAILHIPHSEMLATQPVRHWIERFENATRTRPTEIALPGIDFLGPTFDSKVYGYSTRLKHGNLLPNWIQQVREHLGSAVPIWASVIPQYPFLKVATVMVQDQYDSRLGQACITNPTVQKITDVFLNEIAEFGIAGVVFDLTDIYPNSSADTYMGGLQNTCFCNHCLKQLEFANWTQGRRPFIGNNNLTRFVLHKTPTGAQYIEAHYEWIENIDVAALAQISKARGFVSEEDATIEDAENLLRYLAARGIVTANSIRRLGQEAQKKNMAVAAILGDEHILLTQCTDITSLVQVEAANEYWLPSVNSEFTQSKGICVNQYLSARSTYLFNNFFEIIGKADETIGAAGVESFIEILLDGAGIDIELNPGAVFSVEIGDEYAGFVGIPIGQNDIVQLIEGLLTRGTLGQVVPKQVIESIIKQVKLASPERSF